MWGGGPLGPALVEQFEDLPLHAGAAERDRELDHRDGDGEGAEQGGAEQAAGDEDEQEPRAEADEEAERGGAAASQDQTLGGGGGHPFLLSAPQAGSSEIQTGAWSLAFSRARTWRSTPAALRRFSQPAVEQQMVDPDARVAREGVAPIIPEGEDRLVRMEVAERVGPALLQQPRILGAGLGLEQGVVEPALGLVDVARRSG